MSPILYRTPIAGPYFLPRPWQQYLQALDQRVGGASAPTIPELAALIGGLTPLEARVAALEALAALHTGTPTVQAVATGAGLGATVSLSGTDSAGVLSLTTASGQARRSHAAVLTLTFHTAWSPAPVVLLQPANAAAWALAPGTVRVLRSDMGSTAFTVRSGTSRLPRDGDLYQFSYQCR